MNDLTIDFHFLHHFQWLRIIIINHFIILPFIFHVGIGLLTLNIDLIHRKWRNMGCESYLCNNRDCYHNTMFFLPFIDHSHTISHNLEIKPNCLYIGDDFRSLNWFQQSNIQILSNKRNMLHILLGRCDVTKILFEINKESRTNSDIICYIFYGFF